MLSSGNARSMPKDRPDTLGIGQCAGIESNTEILRLQNLVVSYTNNNQDIVALSNINVTVKRGEFVVLIGPSGSGKTTLLRCVNLLGSPTSGKVFFQGVDICGLSESAIRYHRQKVGMIFQRHQLISHFTVRQNMLMGFLGKYSLLQTAWYFLRNHFPINDERTMDTVIHALGIAEKRDIRVDRLSGGQQQRVAIARAIIQSPVLLLADEPIASLDEGRSEDVMEILRSVNGDGVTVVCSLHDIALAKRYCTRLIAMTNGMILYDGPPHGLTDELRQQLFQVTARTHQ
jgi:phosphonate transport system ATP-binding protein